MVRILLTIFILFSYILRIFSSAINDENLIISLPDGKIEGHTLSALSGNFYYGFQGIPYGDPPIGKLRFKEALPVKSWNGVLDARKSTKICPQAKTVEKPTENEDCLYLNVYTPKLNGSEMFPVLFYIYGGKHRAGDPAEYDFQLLIEKGIVVVVPNYRTGVLGHLSTEDDILPGNLELKDQNLALKWLQRNIEFFNGDPNKVTIAGHSSGSAAVNLHILSPRSKGLFRSAIMQSGSALSHETWQKYSRILAYKLAKKVDKKFTAANTSAELVELLREVPARDLMMTEIEIPEFANISLKYDDPKRLSDLPCWRLILEDFLKKDALISGPIHDKVRDGDFNKVAILSGIVSEELAVYSDYEYPDMFDEDPKRLISKMLNIKEENKLNYALDLKKIYTNDTFKYNQAALSRYFGDSGITTPQLRFLDLASNYTNVYFYQFSYLGPHLGKSGGGIYIFDDKEVVAHCAELPYLYFYRMTPSRNFPKQDLLTQDRMVQLWSNFIKYQNPTPIKDELLQNTVWPKLTSNSLNYLDISNDLTVKINPRYYVKVRRLMEKYVEHPLNTCC